MAGNEGGQSGLGLVLYVASDLTVSLVHPVLAANEALWIVKRGSDGNEKRVRHFVLTPALLDEIKRELLGVEDGYFSGTVTEAKYQKALGRWRALMEALASAKLTTAA